MEDFSNIDMQILIKIIRNIARQECEKLMKEKNVEQILYGTINAVNGNEVYDVSIAGIELPYKNIKNKSSSLNLQVGDAVIVKAINSNLGNAYIAIKMG